MYDKLDFIQSKYEELSLKVSDPAIIADQAGQAEVRERDRRDGAYRPEIRGI